MISMDLHLIAIGIQGDRQLTEEVLEEITITLAKISSNNEEIESIRKKLESTIGITMKVGEGLSSDTQTPWLEDAKSNIHWNYWDAYKKELKSKSFSETVIRVLDEDTDNILNECGNPTKTGIWAIKGLVMGDVQSGKTASYCGLINKAADAGYKVIVLLTGMIEELRSQSQGRLDEGFVGRDSRELLDGTITNLQVGVGRFKEKVPNVLTSVDSDFLAGNQKALGGIPLVNLKQPVLLVMKKNKSALENLATFLKKQTPNKIDLPLLVIDDEADNASVNSKKDDNPTTINLLIRDLLEKFLTSNYVAYTATPFANVFINPDYKDLFPSNFVYSLNAPSNYVGATSIFSETGAQKHQVVNITDADSHFEYSHKKDHVISSLPKSLEQAIKLFLLSCAIRDLRKEPLKHRSMLVNVTRFTEVQTKITTLIKEFLYELVEDIKQYLANDTTWLKTTRLLELHELWKIYYGDTEFTWDEVRHTLYSSTASVKALTINQKTEASERLNYDKYKNTEKGRRVIAIGGLTLSRGLTLEGLCISYFYRNSKAYDTLLQMGRWFGYRTGYDDLCKVWIDPEVKSWFSHIAEVVSELRLDIRRMHIQKQPPIKFGMRVRAHPGSLTVTAANKMRNSKEIEHSVSYSAYGTETPFLHGSKKLNDENFNNLKSFIASIPPPRKVKSKLVWDEIPAKNIADFLSTLNISNVNMDFIPDFSGKERPLISFISDNTINCLQNWEVCLPLGSGKECKNFSIFTESGQSVTITHRLRQFEVTKDNSLLKTNKQRVGEIGDEQVGIFSSTLNEIKAEWAALRALDPENYGATAPGYFYRRYRQKPLLTIHVIEPSNPKLDAKAKEKIRDLHSIESKTIIAISLSFPQYEDNSSTKTPYTFNTVALRNLGLIDDAEGEDDED